MTPPEAGGPEGAVEGTPAPGIDGEVGRSATVTELLVRHGLTTALIIDDGYDPVPRASDLAADADAWDVFFDDLGDEDRACLAPAFAAAPAEHAGSRPALRNSDAFVAAVWRLRGTLRAELWNPLFAQYEIDTNTDRADLKAIEDGLVALGVAVVTSGRTLPEAARTAPLIFVDLFLGTGQDQAAVDTSIGRVQELLVGREAAPPAVVLMSRSTRLQEHKLAFRDEAGLLGAMFRVSAKRDLRDVTTLARTLERLARRRADGLRLAAFLRAWDVGLLEARKRFLKVIRRLDLSDYAQIQDLLLSFEGQPLGSYLLDVFDLVLQHEVEQDEDTIAAAEALRGVDTTSYPPAYVAGSPDLQDLVFRSLYQHPHRARVTTTECGTPVAFGDVLVARAALAAWPPPARVKVAKGEEKPPAREDALVVLTPACDLARVKGMSRVLLMTGELHELTPPSWSYKDEGLRTPVLYLPDGATPGSTERARAWVQWDVKNLRTFTIAELGSLLGDPGSHQWVARLREAHALELQQQLLADLGRVGQLARMPGTFAVDVEAYRVGPSGALDRLSTPALDREGGVLFVGRDEKSGPVPRLVLGEEACDAVLAAVGELQEADVHQRLRAALIALRSADLSAMLERGLPVPLEPRADPAAITVPGPSGSTSTIKIGAVYRPLSAAPPTPVVPSCGAVVLVVRQEPSADQAAPAPPTAPASPTVPAA